MTKNEKYDSITDLTTLCDQSFEIGSLERCVFEYLGNWQRFERRGTNWGIFHRVGVKQGVSDLGGVPAKLILHFIVPYVEEGHSVTPEMNTILEKAAQEVINRISFAARDYPNTKSMRVHPPDYMMRELYELEI